MTEKAPPAGWVVQVTTQGKPSLTPSATGRLSSILGAPSFQYFNVAIAGAVKAVEAVSALADAEGKEARVVRGLTPEELAVLSLQVGDIKPA
jgi:hypothetical protein